MNTIYFKSIMNPHGVDNVLIPKGYNIKDFYAVGDPVLLAHDIIEHPKGYDGLGTYCDELRALGAHAITRSWSIDKIAKVSSIVMRYMEFEFDEPVPYELDDVQCDLDSFFYKVAEKVISDYRTVYDWHRFSGPEDVKYFLKDGYLALVNKFGGMVIETKQYHAKVINDSALFFDGLVAGGYFKMQYDFKDFSFDEITEEEYEKA